MDENAFNKSRILLIKGGTHQGERISAYLFVLVLEVVPRVIRSIQNFQGEFLYTVCTKVLHFFLNNERSVIEDL